MGANTGEAIMKKLPLRSLKNKSNGTSHFRPNQELTEHEAEEYALSRGFHLPVSRLQQSRVGRCTGPRFLKKDGWGVRYTQRFLDEYIDGRETRVVDPAEIIAEAS